MASSTSSLETSASAESSLLTPAGDNAVLHPSTNSRVLHNTVALEDVLQKICDQQKTFNDMCQDLSQVLADIFTVTVRNPPSEAIKDWFQTVSEVRFPCSRRLLSTIYLLTHRFFTDSNETRFDQVWANIMLSTARFVFGYDLAEIDPSISPVKQRLMLAVLYATYDLARLHISLSDARLFLKPRESLEQLHEILAVLLRIINSLNRRCNVYIASVMSGESEDRLSRESLDRFERSLQEEKKRQERTLREQSLLRLARLKQRRDRIFASKGRKLPGSSSSRMSGSRMEFGQGLWSDSCMPFEFDAGSVSAADETMSMVSGCGDHSESSQDPWFDMIDDSLASLTDLTPCSFGFDFSAR